MSFRVSQQKSIVLTTTPNLLVGGNVNIPGYYEEDGTPINNQFYPALSNNNAIKDVSNIAVTDRSITPAVECSINGMDYSPELGLFAMSTQQGANWRICTSPDAINWSIRNTTFSVTVSGVTQFSLLNCAFAAPAPSTQIVCADTSGLEVGAIIGSGAIGATSSTQPFVTQILDASNFLTSIRPTTLTTPTQITTLCTCNDTSGLLVGMGISRPPENQPVGSQGSQSARTIINVINSRKFVIDNTRAYSNATCFADRAYGGTVWCKDLSGVGMFIVAAANISVGRQILTSTDGVNWIQRSTPDISTCGSFSYSPELKRVIVTASNPAGLRGFGYSNDGINWNFSATSPYTPNSIAWSPKLRIFVSLVNASPSATQGALISSDGITWTPVTTPGFNVYNGITWSEQLGIFCGVHGDSTNPPTKQIVTMISSDGRNWISSNPPGLINFRPYSPAWSPQLRCFVFGGNNRLYYSFNGLDWTTVSLNGSNSPGIKVTIWNEQFGFFVLSGSSTTNGSINAVFTTTLRAAPPTSYNVFDSSFNNINELGLWNFNSFGRYTPFLVTSTPYTVLPGHNWIDVSNTTATTVSLPSASAWPGREIMFKSINTQNVLSDTSNNVVLLNGVDLSNNIVPGTAAGRWSTLVSNGSRWEIMQAL